MRGDVARQIGQIGKAGAPDDLSALPRFSGDLREELPAERVAELQRQIDALEPWLQGPFVLAENLVIPGLWRNDERWASLGDHVPDLEGKRVLDVGSNAGYDPFMFKLLGASEVLACEPFEFIHQARFLESIYRSRRGLPADRLAAARSRAARRNSTSFTATASSTTSPTRWGCCSGCA